MVKVLSKEEQNISKFVDKMIFLVCSPDDNDSSDEFFATTVWSDLITHMNSTEIDADKIPRVLHGMLTYAELLPNNVRGETAYLVAEDPDDPSSILVGAGLSGDKVIKELTDMIDEAIGDNRTSFMTSQRDLTIDHLFILYGHPLDLSFSVNKDSIDEASIDNCVKLHQEIKLIEKAVKKEQSSTK